MLDPITRKIPDLLLQNLLDSCKDEQSSTRKIFAKVAEISQSTTADEYVDLTIDLD